MRKEAAPDGGAESGAYDFLPARELFAMPVRCSESRRSLTGLFRVNLIIRPAPPITSTARERQGYVQCITSEGAVTTHACHADAEYFL